MILDKIIIGEYTVLAEKQNHLPEGCVMIKILQHDKELTCKLDELPDKVQESVMQLAKKHQWFDTTAEYEKKVLRGQKVNEVMINMLDVALINMLNHSEIVMTAILLIHTVTSKLSNEEANGVIKTVNEALVSFQSKQGDAKNG